VPHVINTCDDCGKPTAGRTAKRCIECYRKAGGKGAHTSEERDHLSIPLCGAKKKNGQRCRAFAGQGTDHKGIGKCKHHGGSTRQHKISAQTTLAKREMVTLGQPLDVQPHQALIGMLRATAGHVAWLNIEIAELEGLDGGDHQADMLVRLYGEERDRLTRIARACLDAGVDKREVEINQQTSAKLIRAVESAIRAVDGLTTEQRRQFGQVLRLELQRLQASPTNVPGESI
jgi:hypothetical protein